MLEAALAAGVAAAGGDVLLGGVLPTPAAPLLLGPLRLRPRRGHLGARTTRTATTASSSSARDGFKLSDADRGGDRGAPRRRPAAAVDRASAASGRCTARRRTTCASSHDRFGGLDLAGLDVVLDCANGATYGVAPEIFRRLGATVTVARRRARRAQHQRRLRLDARRRARARPSPRAATTSASPSTATATACSPSTATGAVVDGDELIALAALHLRARGPAARRRRRGHGDDELRLPRRDGARPASRSRRRASATATCSRRCASAAGRSAASSPATSSTWASCPSGDGIASALLTLEALGGARPRRPRDAMRKLPQRLVNVRVADRDAAMADPGVRGRRGGRAGRALEGRGRVLVRPSGTEQLVRVMVEAPTDDEADGGLRAPRRASSSRPRASPG